MGKLTNFVKWLSDDNKSSNKKGVDPLRSTITGLRIFTRKLTKQVARMEIQGKRARAKAIERRKAGDIKGSQIHMKSALQFQKWSNATDNFMVRLEGVKFKLEQAKAMNDFSSTAKDIVSVLGILQQSVKAPEIAALIKKIDLGFGDMEGIMEEVNTTLEGNEDASATGVSDDEVAEELARVDAELSIDTRISLPSAPTTDAVEGVVEEDDSLDDLQKQIEQLKRG